MNRLTATLLVITIVLSCEAPHKNPLDPKNPIYNYARVSGVVRTVSLPVQTVPQTVVSWQSGSEQTLTDQQGKFELLLPSAVDGCCFFMRISILIPYSSIGRPIKNPRQTSI